MGNTTEQGSWQQKYVLSSNIFEQYDFFPMIFFLILKIILEIPLLKFKILEFSISVITKMNYGGKMKKIDIEIFEWTAENQPKLCDTYTTSQTLKSCNQQHSYNKCQ